MRQAEVKIGHQYLTIVGENLARVVVVAQRETSGGRTGFVVRRFEETAVLPKVRTAAALRECPQKATTEQPRTVQAQTVPNTAPDGGNWTRTQSTLNPLNTELRFGEVPSAEVRAELKRAGFRWSGHSRCWYGTAANLPAQYQKPPQATFLPTAANNPPRGWAVVGGPSDVPPGPIEAAAIETQRPVTVLHHGIIDWTANTTSPACGADPTRAAMTVRLADATCLTCKGLDRMIPVGPAQTGQAFTLDDGTRVTTTLHELYPAPK